jgi:hypothetical protein
MRHYSRQAELILNGRSVGTVAAEAAADAWGFGYFTPNEAFSDFAPVFGVWAMLVHEEDDAGRASATALDELRRLEWAIDAIHAELYWTDTQDRTPINQLTIDGSLIEWNLGDVPVGI